MFPEEPALLFPWPVEVAHWAKSLEKGWEDISGVQSIHKPRLFDFFSNEYRWILIFVSWILHKGTRVRVTGPPGSNFCLEILLPGTEFCLRPDFAGKGHSPPGACPQADTSYKSRGSQAPLWPCGFPLRGSHYLLNFNTILEWPTEFKKVLYLQLQFYYSKRLQIKISQR